MLATVSTVELAIVLLSKKIHMSLHIVSTILTSSKNLHHFPLLSSTQWKVVLHKHTCIHYMHWVLFQILAWITWQRLRRRLTSHG